MKKQDLGKDREEKKSPVPYFGYVGTKCVQIDSLQHYTGIDFGAPKIRPMKMQYFGEMILLCSLLCSSCLRRHIVCMDGRLST